MITDINRSAALERSVQITGRCAGDVCKRAILFRKTLALDSFMEHIKLFKPRKASTYLSCFAFNYKINRTQKGRVYIWTHSILQMSGHNKN